MKKVLGVLRKRWWIVAILVIVIVVALRAGNKPKVASEVIYTVKRQNLQDTLSFAGSIDAGEKASLQFMTAGKLSYVGVKEGDKVTKNQLLASQDARQVQKTLQKYLNTYAEQRIAFDNAKQVYDERGLPGDKYLKQNLVDAFKKAQYDLNNSVLDVELQDLSLQYSALTTPINGIVVKAGPKFAGQTVLPTQQGFDIVNPETMFFSAAADQTEVVKIHENMRADISFDAYPDEKTSGHIISIGYMPKEGETGTVYEVKIALDDVSAAAALKYRIGMTGDAGFVLKAYPNILTVPSTFVKAEGGKKYVWKQVNGKTVKTYVETGDTIDVDTEITQGLQEGDVIYDKAQ